MNEFGYGINDQNNKPPIVRAKHLRKCNLVGAASQKL